MRLGALLLTGLLPLAAQDPAPRERRLPWEAGLALPAWEVRDEPDAGAPPPVPTAPEGAGSLRAILTRDGTLRILDRRGVLRLKAGLPGRPVKAWTDGGREVDAPTQILRLASATPLSRGVSELPWGRPDFRPGLQGLLWILDDGGRILTLVHPATSQIQYLALPPCAEPLLRFWPDRLELVEAGGDPAGRNAPRRWSLAWSALLPQLLRLAQPAPEGRHGTAFQPFPRD